MERKTGGFFDTLQQILKGSKSVESGVKEIELSGLEISDINEDLHGGPLFGRVASDTGIFGRFSELDIREMLVYTGVVAKLEQRGFSTGRVILQSLSEKDQRIYIMSGEELLVHIRLKLDDFLFRLNPGTPTRRLLFIDWLMTRNSRAPGRSKDRLFPGQEVPGLGIFPQLREFFALLALGTRARGVFNIPEYFHDALLFHRDFRFYDPLREAYFRALCRDLHHHGARRISRALIEGRVFDRRDEPVSWTPGEMIRAVDSDLERMLWTEAYEARLKEGLKTYSFRIG